jgi:hypothetical protein
MRLYALPPIIEEETDHWHIDDPNTPAHKEVLSSTPIYIIEEKQNSFYLNSYSLDGKWIGDTSHQTIEDAKHQADFEYKNYGKPMIEWKEIPEDVENPIEFVLSQINT